MVYLKPFEECFLVYVCEVKVLDVVVRGHDDNVVAECDLSAFDFSWLVVPGVCP